MEKWVITRKGADFQAISRKFHIHPRIAALIRNRDVVGDNEIEKYLHGKLSDTHNPHELKDVDRAAMIIRQKIEEGKKIRIIGDYDIDGINATYILLEGLEGLDAIVDSAIPDRIQDGYGLNKNLIEKAFAAGIDTIVTCDNGIAAASEIAWAKELGMTVIVTDHHEVPYEEIADSESMSDAKNMEIEQLTCGKSEKNQKIRKKYILPQADAVVDPKQEDCSYPFSGICGATVAYKLMLVLYELMGRNIHDLDPLIENVAFATIGDVMELKDENRIYVKEGLKRINHTGNIGMQSLITATGADSREISCYTIGFVLGPCLNASGRLDSATKALKMLRSKSRKEADLMAWELKELNDSRKSMTEAAVEEAVAQVENTNLGQDQVLVIFLPECHESIAGIVAGRIRERYNKPTFVLTNGEEGVKGSGRSIDAYHMYEKLTEVKDLLTKFGGHKLAAGLSLEEENVDAFRKRLNEKSGLTKEDLVNKVVLDMEMPLSSISEELIQELSLIEPFGNGNTKPLFVVRNLKVLSLQILGRNRNTLKLKVQDVSGMTMDAMIFASMMENFMDFVDRKYGAGSFNSLAQGRLTDVTMHAAYYPGINEFRGRKSLQIIISHIC